MEESKKSKIEVSEVIESGVSHVSKHLGIINFHFGHIFRNYMKLNLRLLVVCLICYLLINIFDQQCLWFVRYLQTQGCYPLNVIFSLSRTLCFFYLFSKWKIPNPISDSLKVLG